MQNVDHFIFIQKCSSLGWLIVYCRVICTDVRVCVRVIAPNISRQLMDVS